MLAARPTRLELVLRKISRAIRPYNAAVGVYVNLRDDEGIVPYKLYKFLWFIIINEKQPDKALSGCFVYKIQFTLHSLRCGDAKHCKNICKHH